MNMRERSIPSRENRSCKGPEMGNKCGKCKEQPEGRMALVG